METAPIFISYSRKDAKYLRELKSQLGSIAAAYQLDIFDDSQLKVGKSFKDEIQAALKRARIGVLLLSPDFLTSTFVTEVELPNLLASARHDGLTVCIVHVRPSMVKHLSPLAELQAMNDPALPMSALPRNRREASWARIAEGILEIARHPRSPSPLPLVRDDAYTTFVQKLRFFCLKALDLKSGFQFVGESALYSATALDELNTVVRSYNVIAEELLTRGKEQALAVAPQLPSSLADEFAELLPFALDEIHRAYAFQLNEVRVKINRFLDGMPPNHEALKTQIRDEMQPSLRGLADKVPLLEKKLDRLSEKLSAAR